MNYLIRNFESKDKLAINQIALLAFEQYKNHYTDWGLFSNKISNMSALADQGELIVATIKEEVVGAVCYVPPGQEKKLFPSDWPVIRMLVVNPAYRGNGIGKALTEECIKRAVRDNASLIALHTSSIMEVALKMYLNMGFKFEREAPQIHGIPYGIYIKVMGSSLE